MIDIRELIRPEDIDIAKALALAYAVKHDPSMTLEYVWPDIIRKNRYRLHLIRVHPDDVEKLQNELRRMYVRKKPAKRRPSRPKSTRAADQRKAAQRQLRLDKLELRKKQLGIALTFAEEVKLRRKDRLVDELALNTPPAWFLSDYRE